MKIRLMFFFCAVFLCAMQTWGQTWNLSSTMTATLDNDGVPSNCNSPIASGNIASGSYNGNSWSTWTWSLCDGGLLTLSGDGFMPYLGAASNYPWNSYKDQIRSLTFEGNLTTISMGFFGDIWGDRPYNNLSAVTIPGSVTAIEDYAFSNCKSLTDVTVNWTTPLSVTPKYLTL